jgi:hypothetical protein
MRRILRKTLLICTICGFLAGHLKANNDKSLPDFYILEKIVDNGHTMRRVSPPLLNAFAAPDSATRGLAFDGFYLWAANSGDGNSMFGPKIYRLDPDSGTVMNDYVGLIDHPCGLAWDGQYLWHSAYIGGFIYQLDTLGLNVLKAFEAPTTHPFDLTWYNGYLYAVRGNEPYISVIDTSTGLEVDSIEATYSSPNVRPFGLTCIVRNAPQLLTCDGNYGSNLMNMWNLYSSSWVDQWATEPTTYPAGLAYDSVSERLWVSCYERDSIYIYDMSQVGITSDEILCPSCFHIEARPNPFSYTTVIRFSILARPASQGEAGDSGYSEQELRNSNFKMRKHTLKVYDASGRCIRSFHLESCIVNRESVVSWDGRDVDGKQLPPGVYFIRLLSEGGSVKLVKLK